MIVFVNTKLDATLKARIQQAIPPDATLLVKQDLPNDEQLAAFRTANVLMGNPDPDWFREPLPELNFWQLDSAGFDKYAQVQVAAAVANMGDYFAWPCAETMVAGVMALYRRIPELAVEQDRKVWVGVPVRNRMGLLLKKRVVILGTGTIGQAVKQMLTGFSCDTKMLARTDPRADLHSVDELKAVLPDTDIVINCLPGSARGFFSAELIAAMTPTSIYANVGRGTTTDEPALIAALQTKKLGGAVLDVTAEEPLPADSPLWSLPTVLLTQHTGGGQPDEDGGKVDLFLRNLQHFQAGEPLENRVDLTKGY
ncbi:D-2-hydroxyacid dehydrogenase [Spirosoma sp. KUDC1026]|uniref:D-2-hydroxyacid dehydrogenase n=1 Tax=Spirosoma sp. KUDC1026 TaxID=2745947 RepID=UPI00159BE3B8|nr:D-2-hydroxyacid dehydrogenase [Spirosoma sp. KUDC1026]QKZ14003.1 D-2-hydroxyacid dehydrogenase [Spirosoma sp. KUDC1026]